jgi:4-phospho-D-threonate 3-dehydrogenase / 4-phospho-D-erythronate 3-dehydrogenase
MSQTRRMTRVVRKSVQRPVIAVTMGDPAGVGPELCLDLLQKNDLLESSVPVIVGDARVLDRVAQRVRAKINTTRTYSLTAPLEQPVILDIPDALNGQDVAPGGSNSKCGRASARFIETAVRLCLNGQASAMVTAPICKKALNLAGVHFPGHTEMLASLVGSQRVALMLYSEKIAVAFVTLHQSFASVPAALTTERVLEVGTLLNRYMRQLRGGRPRLALLGLNPHAGEEGLFGDEEERILAPAVQRLRALGIQVDGPMPPDVAFTPEALARYTGHIALYHDQGGIPFKMLAFDEGVNVTMGLGIVRTSPDHGTAFDIAWKGKVRPDSFLSAYQLAVRLAIARAKEGRHAVNASSGNATTE